LYTVLLLLLTVAHQKEPVEKSLLLLFMFDIILEKNPIVVRSTIQ
jgi:hypothetical protein